MYSYISNIYFHFQMAREFLPEMKKRNSGHIVAIASLSSLHGIPNAGAYVASKFGVRGEIWDNSFLQSKIIEGKHTGRSCNVELG